jgi:uncharacterized membrane protein
LTLWWNVPLNEAFAQVVIPVNTDEAAQVWQRYRDAWMIGNSLRTVTAFVALGLLVWVPMRRPRVGD